MFNTTHPLPLTSRKKLISTLAPLLSDTQDLYSQAKQAHWNVRGANFIGLHELFDKIASDVNGAVDEVAERIMQLGGSTQGTVRVVAKQSRLKEYPLSASAAEKHVAALAAALGQCAGLVREGIEAVEDIDPITADMLTEIAAMIEKHLWFVEAHGR